MNHVQQLFFVVDSYSFMLEGFVCLFICFCLFICCFLFFLFFFRLSIFADSIWNDSSMDDFNPADSIVSLVRYTERLLCIAMETERGNALIQHATASFYEVVTNNRWN